MSKFFAQISGYTGTPDMPDGSLKFIVEWKRLSGDRRGGKSIIDIERVERDLREDIKDGLASHLSKLLAPEIVRSRDIVLG